MKGLLAHAIQQCLYHDWRAGKDVDQRHAKMVRSGVVLGFAMFSTFNVVAQDVSTEKQAKQLDSISVTASRAAQRVGFVTPTPTTEVSAEDLQDANVTVFADQLNKMPAFKGSSTPATTSHSSQNAGANFLNLRGLGANRTLILVDGKRHNPTTSAGLVDTNVIPSGLIDRVEVVTGGASAAWGSDAVAGVVNIILKKQQEGVEGSVKYGLTEQGDGEDTNIRLTAGQDFAGGRGHFLVSGEYSNNNGVGSDRDWFRKHYGVIANPAYAAGNGEPQNLIVPNVGVSVATLGGLITSGPLKGTAFLPGGETYQFNYGDYVGSQYMSGGDGLYPGDLISLVTPLERGSVYTRTRYDVGEYTTLFLDASYAFSETNYEMSTSYDLGSLTIYRDNAFLPSSVREAMDAAGIDSFKMGRINEDIGYNFTKNRNENARVSAGIEGAFGESWTWDGSVGYGRNHYVSGILNNRIKSNFTNAVDAVLASDGSIVCRSTLMAPNNGCIPINLFGYGAPSAAAVDYVTGNQWLRSTIDQKTAAVNFRGQPFSSWAGSVSLAFGAEYRNESVNQKVDEISQASGFAIGNPKAMSGGYNVKEAYAEAIIPLLADEDKGSGLDLDAGLRVADYSSSGITKPWKLGFSYKLNDEWRFRVTRSRDIRAPNISELYSSYILTFSTITDPVTGIQSTVRAPNSGNFNLDPEYAKTLTAGVIYQPDWLQGLQLSLDYYDIKLDGAISTLSAQEIVNRCEAGNAALCQYVTRDSYGNLVEIMRTNVNLSSVRTSGFDFEANYVTNQGQWGLPGVLQMRLLASYIKKYETDDGTTVVDTSDQAVNGGGPRWRGLASASYSQGNWRFYAEGRYIGDGYYDVQNTYNRNHVASQFVVNGSARYTVKSGADYSIQVFGGVDNVFDRDPPVAPYQFLFGSPANASTHDILGRRYNLGINFKF